MFSIQSRSLSFPTILTYTGTIVVIVLLVSYAIFQARLMITGPEITLINNMEIVQSERQILLSGTTKNITEITINDRSIITTEDGQFNEKIVLENGYNIVSIKAHDRYGRVTILEKEFVYTPLSLLSN